MIASPLKWHGGKHYLAKRIVALMPSHVHYVEPYFGGGSVLLAKDHDGFSEVVNDVNGWLTNFWKVLQTEYLFREFKRHVEATPFSEGQFDAAMATMRMSLPRDSRVRSAVTFFVCCRQSMAGRMQEFAPLSRSRTRRGMNEQVSAWLTAIEGLPAVHERIKQIAILNSNALDVIQKQDGSCTLQYLDPPYHPRTRSSPMLYGPHDMTAEDHADLLDTIRRCRSKVMISGYRCVEYDMTLADWNRHDFELPNNAAGGRTKRRMIESVWCNF